MVLLQIRRAEISLEKLEKFGEICSAVPKEFRPLIRPTVKTQAEILGIEPDVLLMSSASSAVGYAQPELTRAAEVFTDGVRLFLLSIRESRPRRLIQTGEGAVQIRDEKSRKLALYLHYIGPDLNSERFRQLERIINEIFEVELHANFYANPRFKELKAEGREAPVAPTTDDLEACRVLEDRAARTLAIAVKASGGLLVRDLAKQLPSEPSDRINAIRKNLHSVGIIDAEIVVVCSKTQAQMTRISSNEALEIVSKQGLKCACGRPIGDERTEEALTITDRGRYLLDGSRWLTLLVVQELTILGVPLEKMLVEQKAGGDEMDLLADVYGELGFFELKDKKFSLGNAYSFGAKMNIVRPRHPVIISTEAVGNDAKEHFQQARLARISDREYPLSMRSDDSIGEIRYIEGLNNLREGLRQLVDAICGKDAARELEEVLEQSSVNSAAIVEAFSQRTPSASTNGERADLPPSENRSESAELIRAENSEGAE